MRYLPLLFTSSSPFSAGSPSSGVVERRFGLCFHLTPEPELRRDLRGPSRGEKLGRHLEYVKSARKRAQELSPDHFVSVDYLHGESSENLTALDRHFEELSTDPSSLVAANWSLASNFPGSHEVWTLELYIIVIQLFELLAAP